MDWELMAGEGRMDWKLMEGKGWGNGGGRMGNSESGRGWEVGNGGGEKSTLSDFLLNLGRQMGQGGDKRLEAIFCVLHLYNESGNLLYLQL